MGCIDEWDHIAARVRANELGLTEGVDPQSIYDKVSDISTSLVDEVYEWFADEGVTINGATMEIARRFVARAMIHQHQYDNAHRPRPIRYADPQKPEYTDIKE